MRRATASGERVRGLTRSSAACSPCAASTSTSAYGERRALLGPERRRQVDAVQPDRRRLRRHQRHASSCSATTSRTCRSAQRTRLGMSRTFQTSRLLRGPHGGGQPLPGALGVGGGHFRVLRRKKRDTALNDHARAVAESVGLTARLDALAGDPLARRAAPARDRAGAGRASRGCCCWTSRRPGCRRPSASLLTDAAALGSSRDVTLLIIEHDMDVALTRRRAGDDDARRRRDRRGHAGRDPRQPAASTTSTWDGPMAMRAAAADPRPRRLLRQRRTRCRASTSTSAPSRSRSSAATAWASRPCATRSWACCPASRGSVRLAGEEIWSAEAVQHLRRPASATCRRAAASSRR